MKNVFKSSLYLAVFALAGILFQMSCSNSDTPTTMATSQKIIATIVHGPQNQSFYICDTDGTNGVQVPITLPANYTLDPSDSYSNARLSQDSQTIFFKATNTATGTATILSTSVSGGTAQVVTTIPSGFIGQFDLN